jgi:Icc-related predicted phosphoesterase
MKKYFKNLGLVLTALLVLAGCTPTAPNPQSPTTTLKPLEGLKHRFVFISDTHISEKGATDANFKNILDSVKALDPQPDYIIVGGDIVEGAKKADNYQQRLALVKQKFSAYYPMEKILPLFGNQEQKSNRYDDYHEQLFGEFYTEFQPTDTLDGYNKTVYYKDVDNIRLIVLNSFHRNEDNKITGAQLDWFANSVAPDDKLKLVFVHSPAYPTGTQYNNSLDANPAERNAFWSLVDSRGVLATFSGHEHNYSRRVVGSANNSGYKREVTQIVNGTAGQLSNNTLEDGLGVKTAPKLVNSFTVIDVADDVTEIKTVAANGSLVDEIRLDNNK